jgi:hypothetical protein
MAFRQQDSTEEELSYLRSNLEGIEAIFFELMPFRVPLRRQEIQEFYDGRADWANRPNSPVAGQELKRQFKVKANQVRTLVDSAESLGDPTNRLNLVFVASSLPNERKQLLHREVLDFVDILLNHGKIDLLLLAAIKSLENLRPVEARLLLASAIFLVAEDFQDETSAMPICQLLRDFIDLVEDENWLRRDDPFLCEARCVMAAAELD